MSEEQYERVESLYSYYTDEIKSMLSDLLSVEDPEVQTALINKLQEQHRFG